MPTHRIIQRQKELLQRLGSLMESYESQMKQATEAVTRANEAVEIELRRKMQASDAILGRIRSIKRDVGRPFKYKLLLIRNLLSIQSDRRADWATEYDVSSNFAAKGSSQVPITITADEPIQQLQVCQSIAEKANSKLIAFREKPRYYIAIGRLIGLVGDALGTFPLALFGRSMFISSDTFFVSGLMACSISLYIVIIIFYVRSLNLRILNHYITIDHTFSAAEILYQQQRQIFETAYQRQIEQNQQNYNEQMKKLDLTMSARIVSFLSTYIQSVQEIDFSCIAWTNTTKWQRWQPPTTTSPFTRLGTLTIKLRKESFDPLPLFVFCPGGENLLFKAKGNAVNTATSTIQSLILRLLATQPPGRVRFTFIDPVQFGQSVEMFTQLAQYNPALITNRVWTEQAQIEQQLAEISEYMANVIQNKLQGRYPTIEEYNEHSGQAPIPYRILVVFGFPANFTPQTQHRLVSIAKNGARCGVSTIVVLEEDAPQARGFDTSDFEQVSTVIAWDGKRFIWRGVDIDKQPASATVSYSAEIDE